MKILIFVKSFKKPLLAGLFLIGCYTCCLCDERLKVTTEIVGQKYCLDNELQNPADGRPNKSKDGAGSTKLSLRISLTFINTGSEPLILQKDFFAVTYSAKAKNLRLFENEKFFDEVFGFVSPQFNTIDDKSPPKDKFAILQPSETFRTEFDSAIQLDETRPKMKNGDYYIGYAILTWGGQNWAGEEVRRRWKVFGDLFYKSISTGPILLTVKKPKIIDACSLE